MEGERAQAYLPCDVFLAAFLLERLFMPFEILDHQIFACELVVVAVMVNALVGLQVHFVHDIVDHVALGPDDVPIFAEVIPASLTLRSHAIDAV